MTDLTRGRGQSPDPIPEAGLASDAGDLAPAVAGGRGRVLTDGRDPGPAVDGGLGRGPTPAVPRRKTKVGSTWPT